MPIQASDTTPSTSAGLGRRRLLALAAGAFAAGTLPPPPGRGTALALAVPGPDEIGQPPAFYPALLGSKEIQLGGPLQYLPKAQALIDALAERTSGDGMLARWTQLLDALAGAAPDIQLDQVNRFVNGVRYVSDSRNWGVSDRWATPADFFVVGGDCEDYALVKFVSLHRLGYNIERLRIVLAEDRQKRIDHAFLAVYLGSDAYVLDNQLKSVTPQQAISHYRPLCSFNDHRLWLHRTT